jgi:hypothetical protein
VNKENGIAHVRESFRIMIIDTKHGFSSTPTFI